MRRLVAKLLTGAFVSLAGAHMASAQAVFEVPDNQAAQSILTVDVDRLFTQSLFGQRISREYTEGRSLLAQEQSRIADALRAEELALAAQRVEMDPDLFRQEAEAFDAKAQAIRRAQDAKVRELEETLNTGRERFLEVTRPVLEGLMLDRGASAILDRRSVLLSLRSIDVTDRALEQINATIGDGVNDVPQPQPAAEN